MATIPSIIFQRIASGAVVTGVLPDIGGSPAKLETDVVRQLRGRIWRYKELALGGLFESPVALVGRLEKQRVAAGGGLRKGEEQHLGVDRVGVMLKRVSFSGASTTALTGALVDPYAVLTHIAGETLLALPAFDGSRKEVTGTLSESATGEAMTPVPAFNGALTAFTFAGPLGNLPVIPTTITITTSAGAGSENFTDPAGDGVLVGSGGGSGTIVYATGVVTLSYAVAPAGGLTVTADYGFGNGTIAFDTVVIRASNGVVFRDRGDGRFAVYLNPQDREGQAGNGTIDYATGAVRLRFTTPPATGTTLSADYSYGSGSREYEFLDTAGTQPSGGASLDPAAFTTNMQSDLLVPPGWQIKFVTVGSLTTPGILGIWVSQGMGYTVGQELPGFGSAI